jgi:hypothetical protein
MWTKFIKIVSRLSLYFLLYRDNYKRSTDKTIRDMVIHHGLIRAPCVHYYHICTCRGGGGGEQSFLMSQILPRKKYLKQRRRRSYFEDGHISKRQHRVKNSCIYLQMGHVDDTYEVKKSTTNDNSICNLCKIFSATLNFKIEKIIPWKLNSRDHDFLNHLAKLRYYGQNG